MASFSRGEIVYAIVWEELTVDMSSMGIFLVTVDSSDNICQNASGFVSIDSFHLVLIFILMICSIRWWR